MSKITSELVIKLTEDATKKAPAIAAAIDKMQSHTKALQKALADSGASNRLQASLQKLGASESDVEGVARAMRDYAKAENLAEEASLWTAAQAGKYRDMEDAAVRAVRVMKKEEAGLARARHEQIARDESEAIKAAAHKAAEEKRLAAQAARDVVRAAERAAAEKRQIDREAANDARRSAEQAVRDAKSNAASLASERRRISREEAREERDRIKQVAKEEREAARERTRLAHEQARTDNTVAGVASLYVAHRAEHAAVEVLHEYREFDKERRYSKVVLGATDEQQKPLVDQAFDGGGMKTRYNAAQYLEGQRSLASRGYNKDQVLGLAPVTATLGQAFDLDKLEDGAKLLEGSMLGFGKDVSTKEAANRNAMRSADVEVKSSKISGMTADDITMLLARGAPAARAAHFSEEQLLAFGAALKKINIGGDAAATAFIAMAKNLQSPTHEARTALAAAGINYGDYQKVGKVNEEGFASEVQRTFGGLKLGPGIRAGLHKIFTDDKIMSDPAMYSGAVTRLLKRDLHGTHARDSKAIASLANRYRDDSVTSIDTQALFRDLQAAMAKNPNLQNTIFGSKQGGKIKAGTGEVFEHMLDELMNHSQGFAVEVSNAKLEGFNGELNVVTKSLSNLDMKLGMAFDNGGSGGLLTRATANVGKTIDAISQLNPGLLRAGGEAVLLAGALAALKGVDSFRGGFGFKASAGALTGSATMLDRSAGLLDRAALALTEVGAIKHAAAGVPSGTVPKAVAEGTGAATVAAEVGAAGTAAAGALAAGGKMAAARTALSVGARTLLKAVPEIGTAIIMYDAAKGGIDTAADAIGLKKNSQLRQDYLDKSSDPLAHPFMTADRLWAHLRGRSTREELDFADRQRKAATAAEAPPFVPKAAPPEDEEDDDDDKGEKPKVDKPESGFLARHPDFQRLERIEGARALGGPVAGGKTYLVGERGPELFTAGATGQVTNNRLLLQAVLSSRDYADHGQRTERNRLTLSEVLAQTPDLDHLRHSATAGRVSTSLSTSDVQGLLSNASLSTRTASGDPETAKAVRAMAFELAGAVDGVARAVDRMDAQRANAGDLRGDTPFYGREGAGGHPHEFGGGGRRGFMEGGHGGDGPGRRGFAKRAAEGPSEDIPADGDSVKVATDLLKRSEGFQGTAKWDRNHLRLGFGSDTITDAKGGVHEVKAGDHVTREDAERDLARRIPEFQRRVAREVGAESWKKLSPVVQGALTSMAYNYGGFSKLPSMRAAIASGDKDKIAAAIRERTGDNGGINAKRREHEAQMIERADARQADGAPPVKPVAGGVGERLASFKRSGVLSNEQCVELARRFVGDSGRVSTWRPGEKADAGTLKPGTPVATFLNSRGGEVDRYADGTGGRPKRGLDHAAVFEDYERDRDGKITGMRVAEQYAGSGGVHDKVYPFHSGKFGEHDGSSYRAVKRADGSYLGGRNNPMSAAEPEPAPAKDAAKETTRDAPERPAKDQAGGPADADAGKVVGDLSDRSTYARKGEQIDYKALVVHHTGSRGTPEQIVDTLNKRQLGVQYVMDRDGHIVRSLPEGARAAHILPSEVKGLPLNNGNTEGIEVIAKDDADVTKAQVAAMKRFYADQKKLHPGLQVFGHGYLNPSHKQATEGKTIVDAIRAQNDEKPDAPRDPIEMARAAAKQTPLERRTLGSYMGRDPWPAPEAQDDPLGLRRSRAAAARPVGELHAGLAGLHGKSIKPDVDISGIHEAQAAVDQLHASLERVHALSAKSRSRSHEAAKVAGLGSKLRGGYMHSGSSFG